MNYIFNFTIRYDRDKQEPLRIQFADGREQQGQVSMFQSNFKNQSTKHNIIVLHDTLALVNLGWRNIKFRNCVNITGIMQCKRNLCVCKAA